MKIIMIYIYVSMTYQHRRPSLFTMARITVFNPQLVDNNNIVAVYRKWG